jgi:hypothetical protein
MKTDFRAIGILSVLILAMAGGSGCTSVTVHSNKDAAAVHRIGKLFVLINQGELEKQPLSNMLADDLRNSFSNSPVQLAMSIVSPLELDEQKHDREIEAFHPDAVLTIQVRTFIVDEYGGYPKILYDVSLLDPAARHRLWRAAIDNSGGTALMDRRMREMAEKIVAQLRQDGFL